MDRDGFANQTPTSRNLSQAGAARQPLFSVYFCPVLSIYVCLFADFRRCKPPGNRLTSGPPYLKTAYGQTAGVRNISFQRIVRMSPIRLTVIIYPHSVKIYRRHRRMISSSASQKDYRVVICQQT